MKHSDRISIITGFILLIIAALFLLSLLLQFLDFGAYGPGGTTIFYTDGKMFISVYGFSSFLIPVFLFFAAVFSFLSDWTVKRGIYLFFSVVPFCTIAITEAVCREILRGPHDIFSLIKLVSAILIGLLLVVIEYLFAGIIGSRMMKKKALRPEKTGVFEEPVRWKDDDFSESSESDEQEEDAEKDPTELWDTEQIWQTEDEKNIQNAVEKSLDGDNRVIWSNETEETPVSSSEKEASPFDHVFDTLQEDEKTDDMAGSSIPENSPADTETDSGEEDEEILDELPPDEESAFSEPEPEPEPEPELSLNEYTSDVFSRMEADAVQEVKESQEDEAAGQNSDEAFEAENSAVDEEAGDSIEVIDAEEDIDDGILADEDDDSAENFSPETPRQGIYKIPTGGLLTAYADDKYWIIDGETKNSAEQLKETLSEFNIEADVTGIRKGPVVTMFEILPAPGVRLSKIVALQDNIALRLAASSVRIVAPIPGKRAVGIEVPNKERSIVSFREIMEEDLPEFRKMAVPVILGKDIQGEAQVADLVKMPHLLIAGATGSGKSVCVNSLILSILYTRSPREVRLILIDPKIVELKLYNDIPHLLTPVITEPKKAFQALQYCLCEMERRYALLDGMGVRDIKSYNKRISEKHIAAEKIPYIIVIIDEFADLMAITGKEMEAIVARLAAMSRAVGIHLVLATQRPSIDVITGLIKANIPSRIAFMVASKTDSRIIIDQVGAEKLLGKGDMLYSSTEDPFPVRIQGTFVSDSDVENVVEYVKRYGEPEYIDDEIFVDDEEDESGPGLFSDGEDPLYEQALDIVVKAGKASASYIQRRLKIGYNRAARIVEEMEERGIVGPANGSKPREIIHVP
ncbi:MAG: DNA translocase FtsK [Treponema sp.]|jgi:S-DNA-T family DNA segregation ATPase FtsK/SpoIIIE|nr:DNA translocase FtsK [Treponema sp.]